MMLRMLKPELLCGLGGFALGTAALLLTQTAASAPPPPPAHTDVLAAAAPTPRIVDAG